MNTIQRFLSIVFCTSLVACSANVAGGPLVQSIAFGQGCDDQNEPIAASTSFPGNVQDICIAVYVNAAAEGNVRIEMEATNTEKWDNLIVFDKLQTVESGQEVVSSNISRSSGWPSGTYTVNVYEDSEQTPSTTRVFTIQ